MNEPHELPLGEEQGLAVGNRSEELQIFYRVRRQFGVVTFNCVISQ